MRSRIGRIVRSSMASQPKGTLGAVDWGSILNQVAQAAPAVVAAVSKPKTPTTTSGGNTYVNNTPAPVKKTDYTPYYIGGGLLLAGLAYVATKKK